MAKASTINRMPEALDLALYAGDGVSIRLGITNNAGDPVALEGELKAQIRQTKTSPTVAAEFTSVPEDGTNNVIISLTGEQTADLIESGETSFSGVWDIQWHPLNAEPVTLTAGKVTCESDVTR